MTRYLILGSGGFIGSHYCHYLKSKHGNKIELHLPVRNRSKDGIYLDLNNLNELLILVEELKPDIIINFSSFHNESEYKEMELINFYVPKLLMNYVSKNIKTKLILFGSAAEYDLCKIGERASENFRIKSRNNYSKTKIMQSEYFTNFLQNKSLSIKLIRPFNVIGKGMRSHLSIPNLINIIKNQKNYNIQTKNLGGVRDFIDITDICEGINLVLNQGLNGEIYNLCSGRGILMRDVVDMLIKNSRKDLQIIEETNYLNDDISIGNPDKVFNHTGWNTKEDPLNTINKMYHSS